MKKIAIGSILLLVGTLQTIGAILSGTLYISSLTSWEYSYYSRLYYAIFASQSKYDKGMSGLGIGIFFIIGILLMIIGFTILIREYVSDIKDNKGRI